MYADALEERLMDSFTKHGLFSFNCSQLFPGFSVFDQVAWVTRSGKTELAEPIAVRPTSETG